MRCQTVGKTDSDILLTIDSFSHDRPWNFQTAFLCEQKPGQKRIYMRTVGGRTDASYQRNLHENGQPDKESVYFR